MSQDRFRVGDKAPLGLFLRSAPVVKDSTKVAVLPLGHLVRKQAESPTPNWWQVSTTIQGTEVEGFVNGAFLVPDTAFSPPTGSRTISAVHLTTSSSVTRSKAANAFPLNEPNQPTRNGNGSAASKSKDLTAIVDWLDVEDRRKVRYAPASNKTFCNIYAHDYCYLAGVYLPRVWWTPSALTRLKDGQQVTPSYGSTVREMNANALFEWFTEHGPLFGWNRTFDLTQMQSAANEGQVVVISAQNKVPNRSGHICVVVPENGSHEATRSGTAVTRPLQSQAGRTNRKYMTHQWWTGATFRDWGFWINAT
jgi:hypothetical protein